MGSSSDRTAAQQARFKKLTETPVRKLIPKLAVPTIISMLVTAVYNAADTFFVGRISTEATAAVGLAFSAMAIIDLASILPSLSLMGRGFKVLRVLRMLRALRVLRVFKWLRYSKNFEIISDVIRDSKNSLIAVVSLAAAYILVSALVIFNVEPDSFETFFDAVYWATVSLTTVGYGDIYPVSTLGRIVTMVSSIMGIAIVALPAGIITAGYMDELHKDRDGASADVTSNEKCVTNAECKDAACDPQQLADS